MARYTSSVTITDSTKSSKKFEKQAWKSSRDASKKTITQSR